MVAFGDETSKVDGLFGGINVGCTSGTPILALIPRTNLRARATTGAACTYRARSTRQYELCVRFAVHQRTLAKRMRGARRST